ncbi:MAG TPA: aldo/keto reductase [Candidatus Saccharimonadales bacterium]|nr:aldo/keto reductase [Candidatus Saccharimonadales bacterium]
MSDLETRPIGAGVLQATVVGLGCNNFGRRVDAEATTRIVHAALDEGITFFDTADIYGGGQSEEMLGAALKGRRQEAVIATKFGHSSGGEGHSGGSRRYVRIAVEASLRRLDTDWIDLYQLHTPDPATPVEETLEALTELVSQGKIRCAGSSNLLGWQVADADWVARTRGLTRFVTAQNAYSLLDRSVEDEVIPASAHFDVGMIPYSPLANGLLTGKHRRGLAPVPGTRLATAPGANADRWLTDRNFDVVEALEGFAQAHGVSLLDVAIGGLAAQPQVVSVIAGATSPDQVRANARAGRWRPNAADLAELDRVAPRR